MASKSKNINDNLQKIEKNHLSILEDIGLIASDTKLKPYLVGGMVRDLLLGKESLDIDITVEGGAIKLAELLEQKLSNCTVKARYEKFKSAKVLFEFDGEEIQVDLATTREEIYEKPAELPKINESTLEKDLIRRDFTINALAVSLLPDDFGDVVDMYGGLEDIENKLIRILPNDKSFIDDPTRMIRAIRFANRFEYSLEEKTKKLLDNAIASTKFDNLIKRIRGDRVKIEIRYLFNLPNVNAVIVDFFMSGIFKIISTDFKATSCGAADLSTTDIENQWLVVLSVLFKDLEEKKQKSIFEGLHMTNDEVKIIEKGLNAYSEFCALLHDGRVINQAMVYKILKGLPEESLETVRVLMLTNEEVSKMIEEFKNKTSKISLEITGDDLLSIGVPQGRDIAVVLDKILEMKINKGTMTKDEELSEAKKLV